MKKRTTKRIVKFMGIKYVRWIEPRPMVTDEQIQRARERMIENG